MIRQGTGLTDQHQLEAGDVGVLGLARKSLQSRERGVVWCGAVCVLGVRGGGGRRSNAREGPSSDGGQS